MLTALVFLPQPAAAGKSAIDSCCGHQRYFSLVCTETGASIGEKAYALPALFRRCLSFWYVIKKSFRGLA